VDPNIKDMASELIQKYSRTAYSKAHEQPNRKLGRSGSGTATKIRKSLGTRSAKKSSGRKADKSGRDKPSTKVMSLSLAEEEKDEAVAYPNDQ